MNSDFITLVKSIENSTQDLLVSVSDLEKVLRQQLINIRPVRVIKQQQKISKTLDTIQEAQDIHESDIDINMVKETLLEIIQEAMDMTTFFNP